MHPPSEFQQVMQTLGLEDMRLAANYLGLSEALTRGLPVSSLDRVCETVAPDVPEFKTRIVPAGTLKRRRQKGQRLSAAESQAVKRIARVWAAAKDVYRDDEMTRRFLHNPHPLLNRRTPISVALDNDVGAGVVEDILGPLKYGSVA